MKLLLALSLAAAAVALPQQLAQLPFLQSPPLSLTPDLDSRLASLPSSHAAQLAQHIAQLPEQRLIQLEQDGQILQVTEGQKSLLVFQGIKFRDVTQDTPVSSSLQNKCTLPRLPTD